MSDHTPAPAPPALPTPELIAKLRRLANAATPGPWAPDSVMSEAVNEIILDYPTPEAGCPVIVASTYDDEFRSPTAGKGEANCRFLSACDPQTVLSLVAAAERLAKAERDVTFLADKVIPKLEDRLREVEEKTHAEEYLRGNQLAAISTVLMANTPVTLASVRLPEDHMLCTAAFQDAVRAVEREIALRGERDKLAQQLREVAEALYRSAWQDAAPRAEARRRWLAVCDSVLPGEGNANG